MSKYINADFYRDKLLARREDYEDQGKLSHAEGVAAALDLLSDARPADVIEADYFRILERRLEHLLVSRFISSFDEMDPVTGKYKLDIGDADRLVRDQDRNEPILRTLSRKIVTLSNKVPIIRHLNAERRLTKKP